MLCLLSTLFYIINSVNHAIFMIIYCKRYNCSLSAQIFFHSFVSVERTHNEIAGDNKTLFLVSCLLTYKIILFYGILNEFSSIFNVCNTPTFPDDAAAMTKDLIPINSIQIFVFRT